MTRKRQLKLKYCIPNNPILSSLRPGYSWWMGLRIEFRSGIVWARVGIVVGLDGRADVGSGKCLRAYKEVGME